MSSDGVDVSVRPSLAVVLRNRPFLRLWTAQAISLTAQSIVNFAVIVLTENATQRSFFTSLAILSFSVPPVLVGAFAGVIVDRSNKPRILWITQFLRMLLMVAYFVFDRDWPPGVLLPVIFSITALFAVVTQFFGPAEAATIPLLVPRHHLLAANALFATTYNASLVVGLAILGPILVKVMGLQRLWLFVAALYVLCTALVARLPSEPGDHERPLRELFTSRRGWRTMLRDEFWEPVREGWAFMAGHAPVRSATINLSLAATILLVVATLGPGFVSRTLGRAPEDVSLVLLPASLGMLAGILLVGRVTAHIGADRLISVSMVAGGFMLAAMATTQIWAAALGRLIFGNQIDAALMSNVVLGGAMVAAVGLGLVNSFITVPANTQLQEETDETMRGRVFASLFMISGFLSMLPVLFAGALADIFGLVSVMIAVAVIMVIAGLVTAERTSGHHS